MDEILNMTVSKDYDEKLGCGRLVSYENIACEL